MTKFVSALTILALAGAVFGVQQVAFDDFDIVRGTTNGDPWAAGLRGGNSTADELTFDPAERVVSRTITPDLSGNTSGGDARPGLSGGSFFDWFGVFRRDQDQNGVTDGAQGDVDGPFDMFDDSVGGFPWSFTNDDFGFIRSAAGLDGGAFGILDDDAVAAQGFGEVQWTFDVAGFEDFNLTVDIAAVGDFETSDSLSFETSLDGGSTWTEVIRATADESAERTYGPLESGNDVDLAFFGNVTQNPEDDPLSIVTADAADVATLLGIEYQTITSLPVAGTALNDELLVRMRSIVNSGTEYISFDNVRVFGSATTVIPEPAALPLSLIGLAALMARTRRRA